MAWGTGVERDKPLGGNGSECRDPALVQGWGGVPRLSFPPPHPCPQPHRSPCIRPSSSQLIHALSSPLPFDLFQVMQLWRRCYSRWFNPSVECSASQQDLSSEGPCSLPRGPPPFLHGTAPRHGHYEEDQAALASLARAPGPGDRVTGWNCCSGAGRGREASASSWSRRALEVSPLELPQLCKHLDIPLLPPTTRCQLPCFFFSPPRLPALCPGASLHHLSVQIDSPNRFTAFCPRPQ